MVRENIHTKYWIKQFRIMVFALLLICMLFMILIFIQGNKNKQENICYDYKSLNETLEIIEKNCGSTFFTKDYRSEEWEIFVANVCDGKKCDSKYYKVEDCITNSISSQQIKMELYLDEDYFARERMKLNEKEKRDRLRKWLDFHFFVKKNLLETGKISLIIFNRWDRVMWSVFQDTRDDLTMPSKFNEMFDIKPIKMKYFWNAQKKIKIELEKLHKR